MEYRDALNLILMHGVGRSDVPLEDALFENGFIGCLRPWSGLRDDNYRELMLAILSLRNSLAGAESWPTELVGGIMGITRMAHCYALDANGMLQRNKLISNEDLSKLRFWVQRIETVTELLLRGVDPYDVYPDLLELNR